MTVEVLHIVPTWGEACGISNFAALLRQVIDAPQRVSRSLRRHPGVTLLHYHHELFAPGEVEDWLRSAAGPVVLVSHEGERKLAGAPFAGYLDLRDPEPVRRPPGAPALRLGHPAWTPPTLLPRAELRRKLDLPQDATIIGTSGFLKRDRQFPAVVSALLDWASGRNVLVYLPTSRWRLLSPDVESALDELRACHPGAFRYETSFKDATALNLRLQACDLLWTWTATPARDYVSGVVADHYASGTRMVVSDRPPHHEVLGLPNVVSAPDDLAAFLDRLTNTAEDVLHHRGPDGGPRHDPARMSWSTVRHRLDDFLTRVRTHATRAATGPPSASPR